MDDLLLIGLALLVVFGVVVSIVTKATLYFLTLPIRILLFFVRIPLRILR